MSLVRAEAQRFTGRRFTRVMTALILVILAIVAIGIAGSTRPVTEADRAQARQQVAQLAEQQRRWAEEEYRACVAGRAAGESDRYPPGFACEEIRRKGVGTVGAGEEQFLPEQFVFHREIFDSLLIATAILCLFGFVVAASFVGAEWTSGGMVNLLLWRPRRLVVHTAKLGTVVGGVLAVSVLYLALWVGALWLIAVTRGDPGAVTAGSWASLGLTSLRALVLVGAATAAGFAIASLGRHTAAALGVGIAYALVAELGTLLLLELTGSSFPERFRLSTYLTAWMLQRVQLYGPPRACEVTAAGDLATNACEPTRYLVDLSAAGLVLGAVLVLLVGASYWAMRRRDVA